MHPEFAPVAFIAAFSLLLPLPWHWRARNVATLSLVIWLFVCNIIYAVDAVIWRDNVKIVVPVWCDISASGFRVAILEQRLIHCDSYENHYWRQLCPSFCLSLHLHSPRTGVFDQARTHHHYGQTAPPNFRSHHVFCAAYVIYGTSYVRSTLCCKCWLIDFPDYVVQGHRFDIIEEYGCRPTTYFSIPSLFLVWIPPMVLSLAALVFAGLCPQYPVPRSSC